MNKLPEHLLPKIKEIINHYRNEVISYNRQIEELKEKLKQSERLYYHATALVSQKSDSIIVHEGENNDKENKIKDILSMYPGASCDINFIAKLLFDDCVEDNLTYLIKILKQGVKSRLWDVDPDNPNCYTINIDLIK